MAWDGLLQSCSLVEIDRVFGGRRAFRLNNCHDESWGDNYLTVFVIFSRFKAFFPLSMGLKLSFLYRWSFYLQTDSRERATSARVGASASVQGYGSETISELISERLLQPKRCVKADYSAAVIGLGHRASCTAQQNRTASFGLRHILSA